MYVLIVTDTLWPFGGGGELATYLYARLLVNEGVKVKILVRNGTRSREWRGLDIYSFKKLGLGKYSINPGESAKLAKKLIQWADVVYFATGFHYFVPLVQRLSKPFIVHVHSYFPLCPVGHMYNFKFNKTCERAARDCFRCIWIYESMKRKRSEAIGSSILNTLFGHRFLKFIAQADAIIFVSNYQQKLFSNYAKSLNIRLPKNFVIYNPIPYAEFERPENNDICFLGGLDPIKGITILLKAWLKITKIYRGTRLRAAMTLRLPSLVEKIGINRYPRLGPQDLSRICWKTRAVVMPSLSPEPSPYVAIEALLRGKLLVASRVGGIPELVGDAPGIYLAKPNDAESLFNGLEWALSLDLDSVIELGLRNRELVLERFNNSVTVKKMIQVFDKVMNL